MMGAGNVYEPDLPTNHIERLDDTLIRPGRVDMKLEFRLANKEMITQLFCVVFKRSEGDVPHLGKRLDDDKIVERMAKEFAAKVLQLEFNLAEVLSFLLAHKQSPGLAVNGVEAWVRRIMEERMKTRNREEGVISLC
jgi:mitochondrial chaperone BCS1